MVLKNMVFIFKQKIIKSFMGKFIKKKEFKNIM